MSDYLVCYDIRCPRRLGRIHRALQRQAMALQYSVFLFSGTEHQFERCLAELERLMDPRQDDIRAYPLPQRGLRLWEGRPVLPDDIYWSGLPQAWQNRTETPSVPDKMPSPETDSTAVKDIRKPAPKIPEGPPKSLSDKDF